MPVRILTLLWALFIVAQIASAGSDDAAERLVLATYKLANDASTATGLAVKCDVDADKTARYIITAHHVLDRMNGDSCMLVSRVRGDDGTFRRDELQVPIRRAGKPLWKKHTDHDLAVLPLPDGLRVKSLPLTCLATEEEMKQVHTGHALWLAVFPERAEANDAGFPILRSGSIASYPITPVKPHSMYFVDTTSWKGDSGGPVAHQTLRSADGGPVIVGVVRGMRSITDTVKESRFVERKTDYPLGVSEVLHAVLARELIVQALKKQ